MTKPTNKKLYPLFCPPSRQSSSKAVRDRGDSSLSDDDSDEDDFPLTSLLVLTKTHRDKKRRKHSESSKKKKEKRPFGSTSAPTVSRFDAENDNSRFHSSQNPKPKKTKVEPTVQSKETIQSKNVSSVAISENVVNRTVFSMSESDLGANTLEVETINEPVEPDDRSEKKSALSANASERRSGGNQRNRSQPGDRLYSEAAMDYDGPGYPRRSHDFKNRNIVQIINRRIDYGGCLMQNPYKRHFSPSSKAKVVQNQRSSSVSSFFLPKKWKIPSWISLEPPSLGYDAVNNSTGGGSIDHMTWDAMGVLLAVASNRTISIYDWDMVRAADLRGRSDRSRNCHGSGFKIPPIVRFQVPNPVTSLVWNPFEMDELAVGFRVSGQTIIYNVDRVASWLSKDPSRNYRRPPPKATCQTIVLQRVTGNIADVVFLDAQNLLISVGTVLYRWKRAQQQHKPKQQGASGTLIWRYQPPSPATSLARIGSNLAIVGTNRGHLCLIDWTKRTKVALSFSHEHRPKVLQTWLPHDRLKILNEDSSLRNKMGIVKFKVQNSNQDCVTEKRHWGRCRVLWMTQSGWVLSTILESIRTQENCLVHYSSPKVVYKNADGSLIDSERSTWSLPYNSLGVDLSSELAACWVAVPPVTRILSHHDKFVLDSQPDTVVSKRRSLVIQGIDNQRKNIPLPGIVKGLPQALAVHPSLEWIVVGEGKKLHVMIGLRGQKEKPSAPTEDMCKDN